MREALDALADERPVRAHGEAGVGRVGATLANFHAHRVVAERAESVVFGSNPVVHRVNVVAVAVRVLHAEAEEILVIQGPPAGPLDGVEVEIGELRRDRALFGVGGGGLHAPRDEPGVFLRAEGAEVDEVRRRLGAFERVGQFLRPDAVRTPRGDDLAEGLVVRVPRRVQFRERPVLLFEPCAIGLHRGLAVVVGSRLLPGDVPAFHAIVQRPADNLLHFLHVLFVGGLVGGFEGDAPLIPVLALAVRLAPDGCEGLALLRHRVRLVECAPVGFALQVVCALEPGRVRVRATVVVLLDIAPRVHEQLGVEEDGIVLVDCRAEALARIGNAGIERDGHRVYTGGDKTLRHRQRPDLLHPDTDRIERRLPRLPRSGRTRQLQRVVAGALEDQYELVGDLSCRTYQTAVAPRLRTVQGVHEVDALIADRLAGRRHNPKRRVRPRILTHRYHGPHPDRLRFPGAIDRVKRTVLLTGQRQQCANQNMTPHELLSLLVFTLAW